MSEKNKSREPNLGTKSSVVEETVMLDASSDQTSILKQEVDLAVACVILRSGTISERNLSRAVSGWTIYGTQSLIDRLIALDLIPADAAERLLAEANKCLRASEQAISQAGKDYTQSQMSQARLAHLDSSGRISKLLGLGNNVAIDAGDESRQLFARFSLVRKLGEGGLGTVWLARDENLRRYVAIKEIRSRNAADNAATVARFRREAEVSGRLEHPGIVPIYQFGADSESGRYFYVMRFLGKHTMQDAIAEYHERREAENDEPLLMHRLLTSFVKLCDAVGHAHSRKIIHRDLKPENVALDSFGQVVLLDWGLAKINDEIGTADAALDPSVAEVDGSGLTLASQVLGSPMYMAPEQAAGRVDEIDERTDVYGLGGILFAILTGQPPHEDTHDGNVPASMSNLLATIVSRPSLRAKQTLSSVSPELDAICAKATQNKRYLRYPSASAIAEDVERYMAGDKVSAYSEPFQQRVTRWITAHPKTSQLVGLLVAVVLLTLFVIGYSLRQAHVAEKSFHFQQAIDVAKELSFHLESQADNVIRDSRFITGLPPAQGIIDARREVKAQTVDAPDDDSTSPPESESIWRERYSVIFEGMLRRNESYLGIVFLEVDDKVEPILKLARNVGAGIVRRVPDSQLKSFPREQNEDVGLDFDLMLPGDVILQTSDQINKDAPTEFRDSLSLTAVNSVFDDQTGEMFGLMAIQLDLRRMIRLRIEETRRNATCVYVTDGNGTIQVQYLDGRFLSRSHGKPITEVLPELTYLFAGDSGTHNYTDGESIYATRLRLGEDISKSVADIGIVVQVVD